MRHPEWGIFEHYFTNSRPCDRTQVSSPIFAFICQRTRRPSSMPSRVFQITNALLETAHGDGKYGQGAQRARQHHNLVTDQRSDA